MSDIFSSHSANKKKMENLVAEHFSCASYEDRKTILQALGSLGVDSKEDLKMLKESDFEKLEARVKIIHIRKLLAIPKKDEQQISDSFQNLSDSAAKSQQEKTTKNLAVATGVLGGVTAAAVPLAIFAALFPPITLPIAVAAGAGAGVVAAATAGTGIATAVHANKSRNNDDNDDDDKDDNDDDDNDKAKILEDDKKKRQK